MDKKLIVSQVLCETCGEKVLVGKESFDPQELKDLDSCFACWWKQKGFREMEVNK